MLAQPGLLMMFQFLSGAVGTETGSPFPGPLLGVMLLLDFS
jgi:hypothetical protein